MSRTRPDDSLAALTGMQQRLQESASATRRSAAPKRAASRTNVKRPTRARLAVTVAAS